MRTYKAILFFMLPLFLSGCEEFLDIVPKTQLSPENLYSSEKGMEYGVNGVYHYLRDVTMVGTFNHWLITEVTTDNMLTHSNKEYRQNLDKYLFTASNDALLEQWVGYFRVIGVANTFIANSSRSEYEDEGFKNKVIGEARFLRAYVYFMMVRLWGDVPLVTGEVNSDDDFFVARQPKEQVYDQIFADLEFAEANLPGAYAEDSDAGRITSGAAKAMLAKVHLTLNNFAAAAEKSLEVMNSGYYGLEDAYMNIFIPSGNFSNESVFQLQALTNYDNLESSMGRYWSPKVNILGDGGSDQYTASWVLYNLFGDNDDRKASFVIVKNVSAGKELPYTIKYLDPDALSIKLYGNSYHITRFAEVLLIFAEAENESNGPTEDAYAALNRVRNRAGLEDLITGLDQAAFRDSVLLERRKELYFEGQRWFDLVRTGQLKEAVEKVPAGVNADYFPVVELPKHLLFPVPAIETEINPNLLPNNPGY